MSLSDEIRKTWRYLRLGMVLLTVLLLASVLVEWWNTGPSCLQPSISAYYYTPAQGIVVGSLVAIGACLVIVKGNTETEDALLNVAGMFAPIVALVPTPGQGSCRSAPLAVFDALPGVNNAVGSFTVLGVAGIALAIVVASRGPRGIQPSHLWGIAAASVLVATVASWWLLSQETFLTWAHYTGAAGLFVCIFAVVVLNALDAMTQRLRTTYWAIAATMAGSVLLLTAVGRLTDWSWSLLVAEVTLIICFGVFWIIATSELWNAGSRPPVGENQQRRRKDDVQQ